MEQARKILTDLQWGPFIKSDNSQPIPLRQLELFRAKMVLESNQDMDAKEKADKIAGSSVSWPSSASSGDRAQGTHRYGS